MCADGKVPNPKDKIVYPCLQNYFQALKIYNQALKINYQTMKIYFQALKIIFVCRIRMFFLKNDNLLLPGFSCFIQG